MRTHGRHQPHHATYTMTCCWLFGLGKRKTVKLKIVMKSFLNPMTPDDEELINIITKVVMLPKVKKYICSQGEIDQQKYTAFDDERINTTEVNLWARMKKVELKTW